MHVRGLGGMDILEGALHTTVTKEGKVFGVSEGGGGAGGRIALRGILSECSKL